MWFTLNVESYLLVGFYMNYQQLIKQWTHDSVGQSKMVSKKTTADSSVYFMGVVIIMV